MKTPELVTALRELGQRVEAITDGTVNWGGCCVYAGIVGQQLEALGVPVRGVVASWMGTDVDAQRPADNMNPRAWNANGLYFAHVGLEFEEGGRSWLHDTEGTARAFGRRRQNFLAGCSNPVLPGHLSVPELVGLAAHPRAWNPDFDRRHIPAIRRAVADTFAPFRTLSEPLQ